MVGGGGLAQICCALTWAEPSNFWHGTILNINGVLLIKLWGTLRAGVGV